MDLRTTPEQDELRDECRAWLRANLPWEYGKGLPPHFDDLAEEVAFLREWQRELADAGWVGVTWPVEYGGRAAGPLDHYVVQEELARARARSWSAGSASTSSAPPLLAHGTDAQKQRWLADILEPIELWCQLFSEPEAGSDLASLRQRVATKVDGGWHVNGQKVWTSYAQFADWGLLLARTDADAPKHKGITAMAIDMHQPGVDVRPLRQITDETDFNEVFFDRRLRARRPSRRRAQRRLASLVVDAHARTGHEPSPARHPRPVARGAAAARDRAGALRRSPPAAAAGRGVRRGTPLPAPQLAVAVALSERSRARPGGQRAEAVLERDEQAAARHGHGRAGRSRPRCGGAPTTTPATAAGSAAGSTTNPRRSSRARTRSSARSSASGCWDCRGSHDERSRSEAFRDDPTTRSTATWPRSRSTDRSRRTRSRCR